MNNKHYKIIVFILLAIVVGSFTHCVQNAPIGGSSSASSRAPSGNSSTSKTPEQVLNSAQVDVGIKNFEQIYFTFSELTGIPVTNTTVRNTYNNVEATLPTDNTVKVHQASNQVAITRLAAEFCGQLATNNTYLTNRNEIFGNGVISLRPDQVDIQGVIINITNSFWGEGIIPPSELDSARQMLLELYLDIVEMDSNPNAVATNSKAIRGVCTAALSSAYVTIM